MKNRKGGFEYYLEEDIIRDYSRWSAEEKLRWLFALNKLRKFYPKRIIEIQNKFREGSI